MHKVDKYVNVSGSSASNRTLLASFRFRCPVYLSHYVSTSLLSMIWWHNRNLNGGPSGASWWHPSRSIFENSFFLFLAFSSISISIAKRALKVENAFTLRRSCYNPTEFILILPPNATFYIKCWLCANNSEFGKRRSFLLDSSTRVLRQYKCNEAP